MLETLSRFLTFKKNTRTKHKDSRGRKAQTWGMFFVLLGLIMAVSSIAIETARNSEHQNQSRENPGQENSGQQNRDSVLSILALKSLEHLSIAVLLLGAVGVILEFKSWSKYFEERLADTIMTNRYLQARGQDELGTHLINVFEAYYEKELNYKDSFLEFFRDTLQDKIVAPFRQETRTLITISKRDDGKWKVEEDTTFKCRKVSSTADLQDSIQWAIERSDGTSDLEDYSVILTLPGTLAEDFKDPNSFPKREGQSYVFPKGHPLLKALGGQVYGFALSLQPLKDFDNLHVHENVKYAVPLEKFHARAMSLLTKGYAVVFKYPNDELELEVESFGMDKPQPVVVKQTGLYSLSYESWLLPDSGLAYQFRTIRLSSQPAPVVQTQPGSDAPAPVVQTQPGSDAPAPVVQSQPAPDAPPIPPVG